MLHAIIMAGGTGTRFWPASRAATPKQLLNLAGDQTMVQATIDRLGDLVLPNQVLVVTNQSLVDPIRKQIPSLSPDHVIGEPCKRDTAPCIGLAAGWVARSDPDAIMVVMPSDHVIRTDEQFQQAIQHAARLVQGQPERLVTFGIRPTYPAESFGYIEQASAIENGMSRFPTFIVEKFHEKPKAEVARQYMDTGNFLWNSGIFVWRARTILQLLERFEPDMHAKLTEILDCIGTDGFEEVFRSRFEAINGKSIDFAVMERADHVVVVEAPFQWDDVGSWQSIARLRGTDDNENTVVGQHLGIETNRTIVRSEGDHLVVTIGLKDCIVVHTPDATLVADRHSEESVRQVVKMLEERGLSGYL